MDGSHVGLIDVCFTFTVVVLGKKPLYEGFRGRRPRLRLVLYGHVYTAFLRSFGRWWSNTVQRFEGIGSVLASVLSGLYSISEGFGYHSIQSRGKNNQRSRD